VDDRGERVEQVGDLVPVRRPRLALIAVDGVLGVLVRRGGHRALLDLHPHRPLPPPPSATPVAERQRGIRALVPVFDERTGDLHRLAGRREHHDVHHGGVVDSHHLPQVVCGAHVITPASASSTVSCEQP
jgi:hypothetical protein